MQSSTSRVWFVLALFSVSVLVSCDSGGGTPGSEEPSEVSVDVTGTVTSAENDEPIGDATVEVLRADNENTLASATTDTTGSYEATFTIEESETPNQLKVRVSAGRFMDKAVSVDFQSSVSRDVELQTGVVEASVSGVVADATNGDPIEGAVVNGVRPDSSEQLFETTTSGSGEYEASFEIKATSQPSDIVLSVNTDGFESKELTIAFTEEVSRDVKLEAKTTEATASGLVDRSDTGDPVTNATVTGSPAGNSGQLFETTTNEAGEYEVTFEVRVPDEPDEITVGASAKDFEDSEQTVRFGNEISSDLSLSPSEVNVTVDGTVTAELDGSTIEGADVSIFRANENRDDLASTTSEMDGTYALSFTVLAPDAPDELRLEATESRVPDTSLTVGFSESIAQNITLPSIEISTIDELQAIQTDSDFPLDGFYVQTKNIDASVTANWNGGKGFEPIGDNTIPFSGGFDGNGNVIKGLSIDRPNAETVGIFGLVDNGIIKDVVVENASVEGGLKSGIVAGFLESKNINNNRGTIQSSRTSGSVSGDDVGGLAGKTGSASKVQGSRSDAFVEGRHAAGLVSTSNGTIQNSKATGDVASTNTPSGGLVSEFCGTIINSEASGDVEASGRNGVGGLVGRSGSSLVESSRATGNVSRNDDGPIGGLVGNNLGGTVRFSYATGSVSGVDQVGGLVGINTSDAEVVESFAAGSVSGDTETGGLVGVNAGSLSESFWDTETTGQSESVGRGNPGGAIGLGTDEMQGNSAEENMDGFDFQNTWRVVMGDYPALQWEE